LCTRSSGKSKISGVDRKISMYVDGWRAEEEKREVGENPPFI
jgi:hypothetical protein